MVVNLKTRAIHLISPRPQRERLSAHLTRSLAVVWGVAVLALGAGYPPEGSDLNWSKLTPLATRDQRLQLSNTSGFKKCTVNVYKDGGGTDRDKRELEIGETATNMCNIFLLDKGTVSQVLYNDYDLDTKEDLRIIWK